MGDQPALVADRHLDDVPLARGQVDGIAASVGAELLAVHVVRPDGLQGADPGTLAEQRMLVEFLGGTWHQVVGDDIATALLDFARAQNATQLVLGVSRHGPIAALPRRR